MSVVGIDFLIFELVCHILFVAVCGAAAAKVGKKLSEVLEVDTNQKDPLYSNYRHERKVLSEQMEKAIAEVEDKLEKHKASFKNIKELLKILRSQRDKILNEFTPETLISQESRKKLESAVRDFFESVSNVHRFARILDIDSESGLSLETVESLLKILPQESIELRRELSDLKSILLRAENALKEEKLDKRALEELLESVPLAFKELRYRISKRLLIIDSMQNTNLPTIDQTKSLSFHQAQCQRIALEESRNSAAMHYSKLEKVNREEAAKVQDLLQEALESQDVNRVQVIKEEIKLRYIKNKEKFLKSEELKERIKWAYASMPVEELRDEFEKLTSQDFVSEKQYDDFIKKMVQTYENVSKLYERYRQKLVQAVACELQKQGYSTMNEDAMERLLKGEVIELNTPFGEDYALRVKFDKNELLIRFVRYVDNENALTEYEKEKDIAIGKSWCATFENVKELLRQNGLLLENKYRVEPETKFYYERKTQTREDSQRKGIIKQQERKREA